MLQIIKELFINCTIIIASVTFANMLMRERFYSPSLRNKLTNGFLSGVLGCILMFFSISITPNIFLDFRFMPIVMMGLYVSSISAAEAALVIAVFRLAYFSMSKASLISATVTIIVGIGCGLIGRLSLHIRVKWLLSLSLICIGSSLGLSLVIHDSALLNQVILAFLISMIVVFFLMYFFMEFIVESNQKYSRLKEETEKDFLTNLHNIRHFDKALNKHVERAKDEQKSLSLLFVDIDYFKKVNDQFGHLDGDAVLKDLGRILIKMSRSHDVVTRMGGEEFTVLLVGCKLSQAVIVGERIRKTVEMHDFKLSGNRTVRITVSIGISSIPETTTEEAKLIKQADSALYEAKRAGRNRIAVAGSMSAE